MLVEKKRRVTQTFDVLACDRCEKELGEYSRALLPHPGAARRAIAVSFAYLTGGARHGFVLCVPCANDLQKLFVDDGRFEPFEEE